MAQPMRIVDVVESGPQHASELYSVLVRHAYLGVRVQFLLRGALIVFMAVTLLVVPPQNHQVLGLVLVGGYTAWSVAVGLWTARGGDRPVRWAWLPMQVDTAALTAVIIVAGPSSIVTWTADLLTNGFFVIPVMAATQLRPKVCAVVALPAVLAYLAASTAAKSANSEPWTSILLRTLVIAVIAVASFGLSRVQLSRVLTIGGLLADRARLLAELMDVEGRERNTLAVELHDGALQYVLAARHDVDDVREDAGAGADAAQFDRINHALAEAGGLLRATVTRLHPAVLTQAGLARAISDLCTETARRTGLRIEVDTADWAEPDAIAPAGPAAKSGAGPTAGPAANSTTGSAKPTSHSAADYLLYGSVRELLLNVSKHAQAQVVQVRMRRAGRWAELTVADDGRGIPDGALTAQLERGHIGLASVQTRVQAAGGITTIESAPGAGTSVTLRVPYAAPVAALG